MKFNMGCGLNKLPDYINVDASPEAQPDQVWDLEATPWPWPSNCAEEVLFIHSLEHMGGNPSVFMEIMKEIYRIATPGCSILIHVPHPRHDNFISDPTHVRAITPDTLRLFDRKQNEAWKVAGLSNSPLAIYANVDFILIETKTMLSEPFYSQLQRGEITESEIGDALKRQNNVAYEYRFRLQVRKVS